MRKKVMKYAAVLALITVNLFAFQSRLAADDQFYPGQCDVCLDENGEFENCCPVSFCVLLGCCDEQGDCGNKQT